MANDPSRRERAEAIRISAAQVAASRPHPKHVANGDETKFRAVVKSKRCCEQADRSVPSYLMSFTKGLPHCEKTGLVVVRDKNGNYVGDFFSQFVRAIDSGDPRDFIDVPLGHVEHRAGESWTPEVLAKELWKSKKAKNRNNSRKSPCPADIRAWESQSAGLAFDLEGPDSQEVTMPPAPALGSDELTGEMAEVYAQALLRDTPFTDMMLKPSSVNTGLSAILQELNKLPWFKKNSALTEQESSRHRPDLQPHTAFRGLTPGDEVGPYISQFLLAGNQGVNPCDKSHLSACGFITYGSIRIDQRVRKAKPGVDYMTLWEEWLDVQNGANLGGLEAYSKKVPYRFITTPRDLATYVHYDALYEAYLNACLLMLGAGVPFDAGMPFQQPDRIDHQQAFAHFGGPHILSLVTEVATRALKAVRFQKFNVHRRLRPEALAARLERVKLLGQDAPELAEMHTQLKGIGLLKRVRAHNQQVFRNRGLTGAGGATLLLPMAFCEGSPMHPAYGAGHATVAGACVTILKAFFDHKHPLALNDAGDASVAYVPNSAGDKLKTVPVWEEGPNGKPRKTRLTVEGELNKLASNISIGRDWAGVHFYTDYIESIRLGEQIALGILEEQKLTYGENFSMTVPLFDGGEVRI